MYQLAVGTIKSFFQNKIHSEPELHSMSNCKAQLVVDLYRSINNIESKRRPF